MHKPRFFFVLLAGLLSHLSLRAQAPARPNAAALAAVVSKYAKAGQFNGTVLVAEHGQVLFSQGYGLANREWNQPNTPDTKFRLGSLTKQFTALLVMQQVQRGTLKLDGHITDYLPDYPKASGDRITLHQLLSHTAGIPNYTALPNFETQLARQFTTPSDFLRVFSGLPLEFAPGTKFHYSNSNYFLLGAILEKVTGKPYAQLVQENIFQPLHMASSGYELPTTVLARRAAGYDKTPTGYVNTAYLDMTVPYAAGALYSTTEDLLKWDQALYTEQLLSTASKALMFKAGLQGVGYGWINQRVATGHDTLTLLWHNGGINGFGTKLMRVPQTQLLVVLLDNTGGEYVEKLSQDLLRLFLGRPETPPAKTIAVDAATVAPYAGKYQLAPTFFISVKAEGNRLMAQATGQEPLVLAPTAPGRFAVQGVAAEVEFVKNASGAVEKLILHQDGHDSPGTKVE